LQPDLLANTDRGKVATRRVALDFDALRRMVAFAATPHLLPVLDSIERGRQPYRALAHTQADRIDLVVQRLLEVGAARLVCGTTTDCPFALTRKGRRILHLLRDLQAPHRNVVSLSKLADDDDCVTLSDWRTEV
jgi:hypothetical protein